MKRRAFTLVEVMIVIAILGLLTAIAIPRFHDFQQSGPHKARVICETAKTAGGGDIMFRFAELLVILTLLYLIANILRYCFVRTNSDGNWLFGLSDRWVRKDEEEKKEHVTRIMGKFKGRKGKREEEKE